MLKRYQLYVGLRFELPTRPSHFFRLQHFARPALPHEKPKWIDKIGYVPCSIDEATHVHAWESYVAFLTIERLLKEGNPKSVKERWAFTSNDLLDPEFCSRNDTFLAFPKDVEQGVYVNRLGQSIGQYGDGLFGVTEEDAELANDEDTIHRVVSESEAWGRNLEESTKWREILCTLEGRFLDFNVTD